MSKNLAKERRGGWAPPDKGITWSWLWRQIIIEVTGRGSIYSELRISEIPVVDWNLPTEKGKYHGLNVSLN